MMSKRSVTHATFVLERVYPVAPARVFNAFADPKAKAKWFAGPPDWDQGKVALDFRVGGTEVNEGGPKGGPWSIFNALYQDIVPNERIVYTYEMTLDGKRISVSVASIELRPEGSGTRLVLTEQGAYLDGWDHPDQREAGTKGLLDALGAALKAG
jgi:uncharacterized protein YndB with AHSA1/START domain